MTDLRLLRLVQHVIQLKDQLFSGRNEDQSDLCHAIHFDALRGPMLWHAELFRSEVTSDWRPLPRAVVRTGTMRSWIP